jgi:hypothetical protein
MMRAKVKKKLGVRAKAKAKASTKRPARPPLPRRVLLFDLSEVPPVILRGKYPTVIAKAQAEGVSARIIARPFYVYDKQLDRHVTLPPERKFLPAEDKRGYRFTANLVDALYDRSLLSQIVDTRKDRPEWCYGWHNSATVGDLAWAFAHCGFQVVRFTDLYDPANGNRLRRALGQPAF